MVEGEAIGRRRPAAAQLPLDLKIPRADKSGPPCRAASNAAALDVIAAWPRWPHRWLRLVGPPGAGKSRLARHFAHIADAPLIAAAELAEFDPITLGAEPAMVLEDIDRGGFDETTLFHVLNAAAAAGSAILFTGRDHAVSARLATADVASRLRSAPVVTIAPPDDDLLRQVLAVEFAERQLVVDPSVVDYLLVRMERSLTDAIRLVDQLDRHGLARQRRITRPLATEILSAQPAAADTDEP